MALDYRKCAQEIADHVGGGANVVSAEHCATRLRLSLADKDKVDREGLEAVEGVRGTFESKGQLQLIIGTGVVNKVFDEFIKVTGAEAGRQEDGRRTGRPGVKLAANLLISLLAGIVAAGLMFGVTQALDRMAGTAIAQNSWYSLLLLITGAVGLVLAMFLRTRKKPAPRVSSRPVALIAPPTETVIRADGREVLAPAVGKVIAREEIPDETFASGVLGEGVAIEPEEGVIFAPFDGEVALVADTKHAVGLTNDAGFELLIHVGIDTVAMNGDGFEAQVREGQKVRKGDVLLTFDREKIRKANHPDCVVILLKNADEYKNVQVGAQA